MQNELTNSFLWERTKHTKLVNLSLEGIQFVMAKNQMNFPLVEKYFQFSNDAKYFAFENQEQFYIINCLQEQIIQQIPIQSKYCMVFKFSEDSQYFVFIGIAFKNFMSIYQRRDFFEPFDCIYIEGKYSGDVEIAIKENILYLLQKKENIIFKLQTYNLEQKYLGVPIIFELKSLCLKQNILFPLCKSAIILDHRFCGYYYSNVCFLTNVQGKRLKKTKQYDQIDGMFGFYEQENLFRLFCKFCPNHKYNKYLCKTTIFLTKKDLIVSININDYYEQETFCIEIQWFHFQIRKFYYRGFQGINKKGAFKMLKDGIFEFYYF